jgi:protein-S-isoprenylcysteine O-methyltransferase Ste14
VQKILPPTHLLIAMILMSAAQFVLPLWSVIAFPWRIAGLLPLGAGVYLNLRADRQLKQRRTTVKPFERSVALVTDGVFAWTRSPMYLGMALILAGMAVLFGSLSPWVIVVAFVIVIDRVFIVQEERQLDESFGVTFRQYRSRVRRWL